MHTGQQFVNGLLPVLPIKEGHPDYYSVKVSSGSTALEKPPKTLAPFAATELAQLLTHPQLAAPLGAFYSDTTVETTHKISVEADVEHAAHLYLIHDLNLILQDFVASLQPPRILHCHSQVMKGRSRTDIAWDVDGVTVLILEAKNVSVVNLATSPFVMAYIPDHWQECN